MGRRNRNTVRLDEHATLLVRAKLLEEGWTQLDWSNFGNASLSTVRRLLRGKGIELSIFQALIKALNLRLEEVPFIRGSKPVVTQVVEEVGLTAKLPDHQYGVVMTGRYNQDNKAEIDRALRHLQGLMVDAEFCFEETEGAIMVSGSFSEENAPQIRMIVNRLERLLSSCHVTW
jgi:hypothetical protein